MTDPIKELIQLVLDQTCPDPVSKIELKYDICFTQSADELMDDIALSRTVKLEDRIAELEEKLQESQMFDEIVTNQSIRSYLKINDISDDDKYYLIEKGKDDE